MLNWHFKKVYTSTCILCFISYNTEWNFIAAYLLSSCQIHNFASSTIKLKMHDMHALLGQQILQNMQKMLVIHFLQKRIWLLKLVGLVYIV